MELPVAGPEVAAVGLCIPGAGHPSYPAHLVLARRLARLPGVHSTGCGYFGPADTRDDDVMVVVGGPGVDERVAALLANPGPVEPARAEAIARLRATSPVDQARWAGRGELLQGQPNLLADLRAAVASTTTEDVRAAAGVACAAPRAVLVGRHEPSRPVPSPPEPAPPTAGAPGPGRWFAPVPADRRVAYRLLTDRDVDGVRHLFVAAGGPRSAVRLAVPVSGTAQRGETLRLFGARLREHGLTAPVTTSWIGDRLVVAAEAVDDDLPRWADVAAMPLPDVAGDTPQDPGGRADALSLQALGPVGCGGATLVVVGPSPVTAGVDIRRGRTSAVVRGTPRLVRDHPHGAPAEAFTLRAPADSVRAGIAAQHLAVAVLAGVGTLPWGGRGRLAAVRSGLAVAGREPRGVGVHAFVKGAAAPGRIDALLDETRALLADRDLTGAELAAAVDFCTGQWWLAFDSAAGLADLTLQQSLLGGAVRGLDAFPLALAQETTESVTAAWRSLFDPDTLSGGVVEATVRSSPRPTPGVRPRAGSASSA